jgi:hypothetical protein
LQFNFIDLTMIGLALHRFGWICNDSTSYNVMMTLVVGLQGEV